MSLMNVTAASLSRDFAKEVPEMYVIIAKHSVLGMDPESIREVLGCTTEEIQEVLSDPLYKDVRLYIGGLQAESSVSQTLSWDGIEDIALKKLSERLPHERDSEFLLKVAAVANKAQRRQGNQNVLNPAATGGRAAITLTQRLIQRISDGKDERIVERQLSIKDGSMANPSFEEIDSILSVSPQEVVRRTPRIATTTADPLSDDLESILNSKGFDNAT